MAAEIGTSRTDGHYNGPHGAASCIFEFENGLVDITSIPVVELSSYAVHSHAKAMGRPNERASFQGWRVPSLGMTVVGKLNISGPSDESDMIYIPGPYITFYAMINQNFGQGGQQGNYCEICVSVLDGIACLLCRPFTCTKNSWLRATPKRLDCHCHGLHRPNCTPLPIARPRDPLEEVDR